MCVPKIRPNYGPMGAQFLPSICVLLISTFPVRAFIVPMSLYFLTKNVERFCQLISGTLFLEDLLNIVLVLTLKKSARDILKII